MYGKGKKAFVTVLAAAEAAFVVCTNGPPVVVAGTNGAVAVALPLSRWRCGGSRVPGR
jgi:hypothetical protein